MNKQIKKLKELEKQYRLLSENLVDAIWVTDFETFKFEYMTESIERISGYSSAEYFEIPFRDRMSQESFEEIKNTLADEVPKFEKGIKNIRTIELELIHKTGTLYWVEIRARLYRDEGRIKIVGVTRDITERKKADQKKDQLLERLGTLLAEKNKLLEENKVLHGLLPICSGCKRIRDENGKWWPLDTYVKSKTEVDYTHTICLDCKDIFYGEN